jgi:hypothetical protein
LIVFYPPRDHYFLIDPRASYYRGLDTGRDRGWARLYPEALSVDTLQSSSFLGLGCSRFSFARSPTLLVLNVGVNRVCVS